MPLGASRAKPTIAVGFSIALKTATKCSRSISIQAFNRLNNKIYTDQSHLIEAKRLVGIFIGHLQPYHSL